MKGFLTNYWKELRRVTEFVRKYLSLSPLELFTVFFTSTLVVVLLFIFVFWGFNAINRVNISFALLQAVLLAFVGLGAQILAECKMPNNVTGDEVVDNILSAVHIFYGTNMVEGMESKSIQLDQPNSLDLANFNQ